MVDPLSLRFAMHRMCDDTGTPGQEGRTRGRADADAQRVAQESIADADRMFFRYNLGIALAILGLAEPWRARSGQATSH